MWMLQLCGVALVVSLSAAGDVATKVAVVGGGIAGGSTVLELVRRRDAGEPVDVTLFEYADKIGHEKSASGIIAASLIFARAGQSKWSRELNDYTVDDVYEQGESLVDQLLNGVEYDPRLWWFAKNYANRKIGRDPRMKSGTQLNFLKQSRERLESQLDQYPELCYAIIGPHCCRNGSKARAWMDKQKISCEVARGWAHAFMENDNFQRVNPQEMKELNWKVVNNSTGTVIDGAAAPTLSDLTDFLGKEVAGAVWNNVDQGFVRVEDLFPILTKLFKRKGVTVATNCKVSALRAHSGGRVEVLADDCESAGIFDKVIITAGANSVPLLTPMDDMLREELIPLKGFACATEKPLIKKSMLGVGVQPEEYFHYIRSNHNGGVHYGFGHKIGTFDDELLAPQYEEDAEEGEHGIKNTGLGVKVLQQDDVQKLSGLRPLSCFGNFPMLKRYDGKWSGVVLNTGGGFNGFTLSWKSAEIAVDTALHGPVTGEWKDAMRLYSGCDVDFEYCFLRIYYAYVLAVLGIGLTSCCVMCCTGTLSFKCWVFSKARKEGHEYRWF